MYLRSLRMKRRRDTKTYSTYVETIVSMRLLKLLNDGFTVDGFHPRISSDQEFCCKQGGNTTPVRISSSDIPPEVMPGPIAAHGKGGGRGRGNSDSDSDDKYEDDYKDEDKDEDDDEQEDDNIRPYYWCIGCLHWHEIVTFLLP
jgi:hypothetical protein